LVTEPKEAAKLVETKTVHQAVGKLC
jgi:hypothetical protein